MTNEEAIEVLKDLREYAPLKFSNKENNEALNMAINALQENPKLIEEAERWKAYFEEEIANEW